MSKLSKIKFKYLSLDELIISLDRLSRFKLPEESYFRVFSSILSNCLITPKYSKKELETLDAEILSKLTKKIWNSSVDNIFGQTEEKNEINILKFIINKTYKNIDEKTKKLINTDLKINQILNNIDYDCAPINLKFLIKNYNASNENEILNNSKKYKLLFPINKVVIVEGITEEILLPVFANKLKLNFEEKGILLLGAGGKSKSPALYLKLKDKLKIPIILLFDNDAKEIKNLLDKQLNKKDMSLIIEKGEFEDILSLNLLKRSLNKEYEPITQVIKSDLLISNRMTENIEYFYKSRHLGEFKKSKLSKIIAENVKYKTDISKEIKELITIITK